jgi:hypothetical protein
MAEAPRSNRPAPRTPAAIEAELRRRIRAELEQARTDANGQLEDAALASIIARAVAAAVQWHLDAPEHTRNATLSSRTWRPAGGPRGGRPPDMDDRPPRDYERRPREYDRSPPREYDRDRPPPREYERDRPPPRDYDRPPPRDYDRPRREYDRDFEPRPRRGGFKGGGGGGFKRGGFGPRRPPRPR